MNRPKAHHREVVLALALAATTGCYSVPPGKSAIQSVEIKGTRDIDDDELRDRLATRESSRFLGLFSGVVFEYETFDRHVMQRDLARIERYLRARGYYEARVQATRVVAVGEKVYVTIDVEQGEPTVVESRLVYGDDTADEATRRAVRRDIGRVLPLGAPLDEDKLAEAEKAAVSAFTKRGHAAAKVTRSAEVDIATHKARLSFEITPGRIAKYGDVTFENLGELNESAVRRVFGVEKGDTYDSDQIEEARQALLNLGVFASVDVTIDFAEAERSGNAPVKVRCEVSKLRAVTAGFGAEFDALKSEVHVLAGWQSSNFFGDLRKFDVRATPGIVLYPTSLSVLRAPDAPLYEHRLNATLKQPALFEKRITGTALAEYSVYPVLLPQSSSKVNPNVLGYHELRGEVGVERPFFEKLFVNPRYGYQANFPFDYLGETGQVDRLQISYVDLFVYLDLRDHPLKPRKGLWIGSDFQRAGSVLQGDADDFKMQPEIRGYIPLPKHLVLALRGAVGFLFPFNYSEFAQINFANPGPSRLEAASRDYQILFFRGFFGGGPTSNRGYPLRSIGPRDLIPYLSPAGQSSSAGGCNPADPGCLLPTGGLSLWEANAEVRIPAGQSVSVVVFCDSGDVSPFRVDIHLDRPHLSCGTGGRYDTPVGPIRLDVGYRIPGVQYGDKKPYDVDPDTLLGLPIAISFAIGEAF